MVFTFLYVAVSSIQLYLTQRAYVSFIGITASNRPAVPPLLEVIDIIVSVENSGNIPALNVRTNVNWRMFSGEIPADFDYPDWQANATMIASQSVIAPRGKLHTFPLPIPTALVAAAAEGKISLYVWGRVRYQDIFRIPHAPTWCAKIIGNGRGGVVDALCPTHNSS